MVRYQWLEWEDTKQTTSADESEDEEKKRSKDGSFICHRDRVLHFLVQEPFLPLYSMLISLIDSEGSLDQEFRDISIFSWDLEVTNFFPLVWIEGRKWVKRWYFPFEHSADRGLLDGLLIHPMTTKDEYLFNFFQLFCKGQSSRQGLENVICVIFLAVLSPVSCSSWSTINWIKWLIFSW